LALKKATVSFIIIVSLVVPLIGGFLPAQANGALPLAGKVIIMEPGHGTGTDNRVGNYSEQTAMLILGRSIRTLLVSQGAEVILTRDSSATVPLPKSCAIINRRALEAIRETRKEPEEIEEINELIGLMQGIIDDPAVEGARLMNSPFDPTREIHPDLARVFEIQNDPVIRDNFLVISLHSNASSSSSARGAEVYYISPTEYFNTRTYYEGYSFSAQSRRFGDILLNHIRQTGMPRRTHGLRAQNYFAIREHNVPGVLAENGFHTNPTDRAMLLNPSYLENLATAYVYAIAEYFGVTVSLPAPPPVPPPGSVFYDVPNDAVALVAINWAQANGIVTGANGMFYPTDPMTRAQYAFVLWRYSGRPAPRAGGRFSDVSPAHIAYSAITWASENGIVTGTGDNRFMPEDNMTRTQMVLMMYRYSRLRGKSLRADPNSLNSFSDRNQIIPAAQDAMRWGVTNGLITGRDDRLIPNDPVTREQVVLILYRYAHGIGR